MLIDKLLFSDQTPLVLKKGLDFQSARNLMISTNVSNMETPDFKAHDINFEKQLQEFIKSGDQIQMKSTNNKHFGPSNDGIKSMEPEPFELNDPEKSNGKSNLDFVYSVAREIGENLVKVGYIQKDITQAIHKQLKNGKYPPSTLYGNGSASSKIANKLSV